MTDAGSQARTGRLPDWAWEVLQCPQTRQPLQYASAELLAELRALQASGRLANALGLEVAEPIEGGLVNADNTWFYGVWSGIPNLVPGDAIPLADMSQSNSQA